jgi:hypothetical protein
MVMPPITDGKTLAAAGAETEDGRRCARHGHRIGGGSPSWGELVATTSRGQLRVREGAWGRSPVANRSTERVVNSSTGRSSGVSVPLNATPEIQSKLGR